MSAYAFNEHLGQLHGQVLSTLAHTSGEAKQKTFSFWPCLTSETLPSRHF